ncbi:MAG: F0F1 ATP synthase subunit A [Proteobacteria bacterium]|nr:F0F1 ATP synthase subunit A [Pseudomonadota bacterium]
MAGNAPVIDPIHQFEVNPIAKLSLAGYDISFTNASLYMIIVVAVITAIMVLGSAGRSIIPGRLQAMAEMLYEFIENTVDSTMGKSGRKFFPLVFSLFMFVLVSNFVGMIPGSFTVTSHIIVTFALASIVILTVIIYGVVKHGTHFFGLFVPSGVPKPLLIALVPIEVISFVSRPISLSMRLFANMLAGHIALKVFAGFIVMLSAAGMIYVGVLPMFMIVAMTALEFLVAGLQAFVFTILTCIYLNDALHPGH